MKVSADSSNTVTVFRGLSTITDTTSVSAVGSHDNTTHADNASVTLIFDASTSITTTGWNVAATTSATTLDARYWVFESFGEDLLALLSDGALYKWDTSVGTGTRAAIVDANAPTASRHMLVSTPDRHLVFYGTETTIGDPTTQDDMFVRFSDQEDINTYTPTATNTAGTQRLADGSQIRGAIRGRDAIYVWTDTALFTQRFVGQPFTFAFAQVGTNCGLVGQNACVEVDGSAYWMSENGFFRYAGKLESLPCLVEDFVYANINLESVNQMVFAGLNN